jgi:hypothetical protein
LWSCIRSSMASISDGFCSCDLWLRLLFGMAGSPGVGRDRESRPERAALKK